MKLMKATLMRLWRLTRATSIAVGLAVVVALVGGVVSQAVAAPSGTTTATAVLKGVSNTATAVTTLINSGTGAALGLQVKPNNPPLTVNPDAGTATNLSADKLDGLDSGAFLGANGTAANAEKLDNMDSSAFANSSHTHSGEDITSGTVDADRIEDGSGSGLDADKLDGKNSTDFMTGHYYIRTSNSGEHNPGPANGFGVDQANCDLNDIAVSGGYGEALGEAPLDRVTVVRDHFQVAILDGVAVPTTWNVAWWNDDTPEKVTVWVLCLDR